MVGPDAGPPPDYPDETVTGWTPDGDDTTLVGTQTVTIDNMILEDVDIGGCLVIDATNVTVRRARIRCQGTGIRVSSGASALIEDVTVDGEGEGELGVLVSGTATMRRLDVHGFSRGVRIQGDDSTFEDSYVHEPVPCTTPVDDEATFYQLSVSFADHITVRHNHLDRGDGDTCTGGDSTTGAHAAYLVQAYANSVFDDNLLDGGSGWCLKIQNTCKDLAVTDNHFGATAHATCATKGVADSVFPMDDNPDNPNVGCSWTGNVWDASGETVAPPD
ncbi:MAG TPA: right-handed parallel beta-helix repeat-containing protein [Kofleriaceae bacterium]|nr:right-handed parallel beta-helix repeat-containing protein [Kofleriaceae bacterium]